MLTPAQGRVPCYGFERALNLTLNNQGHLVIIAIP